MKIWFIFSNARVLETNRKMVGCVGIVGNFAVFSGVRRFFGLPTTAQDAHAIANK